MSRKPNHVAEGKKRALMLKITSLLEQGRNVMLWGAILEYQSLDKPKRVIERKRERKHQDNPLDEYFVDHPPFSGNEMLRFQTKFEATGVAPTFRNVLLSTERSIKLLLRDKQIGPEARSIVNDIRDQDSYWSKLLRKEKKGVIVP